MATLVCVAHGHLGAPTTAPESGPEAPPPKPTLEAITVSDGAVTTRLHDGTTLPLTLEPKLQRATQRLLAQAHPRAGAIVVIDVKTGHVLAWAGSRGSAVAPSVVSDTLAPAASLFKIVTSTALIERHIAPDRSVCVNGGTSFLTAEHLARPHSGSALCGPFREALGRSRNAVFAQLATRFLGRDHLIDVASRFGFNGDAPLDVTAPIGRFDPPEDDLGFARAAAGFVGSRLSPVGAAQLATTVASGGRVLQLKLFDDGTDRRHTVIRAMTEATARELTRMMEVTVHSGTCREAFTDPDGQHYLGDVRVAGKTGTLQPHSDEPLTSWFVGFAPSRQPRIAISVLLENGVGWRRKANQVGRDVFRAYFADRNTRGVTVPDGL
jgi:cell division protein FtsI/penicillin-binding protein 2